MYGVLCDRKLNVKMGKVYMTVVTPALMYSGEGIGQKSEVAQMRMLRRMCGVTKLDRKGNERNSGNESGTISKKV